MICSWRERGFLTAGPMLYAALAAGAVIIGLMLALKVQSARLDAKDAELEACATRYAETLKLVARQNEAAETLQADSEKRRKQAQAALAKAREAHGKADSEIARLRGLATAGLDCAGAVAEVRKGLRP